MKDLNQKYNQVNNIIYHYEHIGKITLLMKDFSIKIFELDKIIENTDSVNISYQIHSKDNELEKMLGSEQVFLKLSSLINMEHSNFPGFDWGLSYLDNNGCMINTGYNVINFEHISKQGFNEKYLEERIKELKNKE